MRLEVVSVLVNLIFFFFVLLTVVIAADIIPIVLYNCGFEVLNLTIFTAYFSRGVLPECQWMNIPEVFF